VQHFKKSGLNAFQGIAESVYGNDQRSRGLEGII